MKALFLSLILSTSAAAALGEPMWFKTVSNGGSCTGCQWTIAQGEITAETPVALRAHLAEEPYPGHIEFNSAGGNLGAALELGRIIRAHGLATAIGKASPIPDTRYFHPVEGGTCQSACAFAFLAGTARYPGEPDDPDAPGHLGMHQFFTLDGKNIPSTDTQQIMGQVLFYILEMGIDAELLTIAARTPPDRMHYFTTRELRDLGVITNGGSETMGLFVDQGGIATGWKARLDSGEVDRTITLRCSQSQGWLLRIRDHGTEGQTPRWNFDYMDGFGAKIGAYEVKMGRGDIVHYAEEGFDSILEVRLPDALAAYAGQELWFHTNLARNFMTILSADETLPDAETFSVLTRACGD